ncbi:MAG: transposase domain-containing protein [Pseudonocardiaceae bacterium]
MSVGVLTKVFPPDLVEQIGEIIDTRRRARRLLPARLMVLHAGVVAVPGP